MTERIAAEAMFRVQSDGETGEARSVEDRSSSVIHFSVMRKPRNYLGVMMARHTVMPPRKQRTPHGDVTLTSRWMRDRYLLVVYGDEAAVRWLFPRKKDHEFQRIGNKVRYSFVPAPEPVTVERELRRICQRWQDSWEERRQDERDTRLCPGSESVGPEIQTVGQLFAHLHAERAATVAKMTTDRDRYKLRLLREALDPATLLQELSADRISLAVVAIGRRTSPSTANACLALLKTYLNWACAKGFMSSQEFKLSKRLRVTREGRHLRDWWTTEQIGLALQCAAEDPHQPTATLLVACGCYLGLRPQEIIMLRWQDLEMDAIDPKTGESRPVCHITPHDGWTPKDGEARDIPIATPLLEILTRHRQENGYLLNPEPHRKGRPRGGTKGLDYRYDPKKVWLRIMQRIKKKGGKAITMYGMRHSFASNLLIHGVSDVKVSRWLGHADTRMLHRHYGHLLSYDPDINATCATAPYIESAHRDAVAE